jgi:hypothetical protein
MKSLEEIQQQLQAGRLEFTRHALKRAIERNISEQEIKQTSARIIGDKLRQHSICQ